jgi:hypothetical protein
MGDGKKPAHWGQDVCRWCSPRLEARDAAAGPLTRERLQAPVEGQHHGGRPWGVRPRRYRCEYAVAGGGDYAARQPGQDARSDGGRVALVRIVGCVGRLWEGFGRGGGRGRHSGRDGTHFGHVGGNIAALLVWRVGAYEGDVVEKRAQEAEEAGEQDPYVQDLWGHKRAVS